MPLPWASAVWAIAVQASAVPRSRSRTDFRGTSAGDHAIPAPGRGPAGAGREPARPGLAGAGGGRDPAAVPDRLRGTGGGLGQARVQPRPGDPVPVVLHVPARAEGRAPRAGAGSRPLAGGRGHRALARHRARRQPRGDRRPGVLRADRLGGGAGARGLRLDPGPRVLALGAAPRLHAAAAAVHLLEGLDQPAARLLGGRRRPGAARRRAGVPRRQHHRPRRLQAAGGRGLFGAALPVPDHELHLRLRRALPRPALAQGGAAPVGDPARGLDELGPDRHHRHPGRPLRHRPGRGLPARLRGLGDLSRLHRHPVCDGQGDAAALRRPPAARRGAGDGLLRARGTRSPASATSSPRGR